MRAMKDSGVEWIGEIPTEWKVVRLKNVLTAKRNAMRVGPFGSQLKSDDVISKGYPVYNQRTVLDDDFHSVDHFVSGDKYKSLIAFKVDPLDILITSRGTIGKIAIAPPNVALGIIHPCIIKFSIDPACILDTFLKYIFNDTSITSEQLVLASNATTIPVVYSDNLRNILFALPSLSGQQRIASYLDARCAKIDTLISKEQAVIEKLQEYKQSLITRAVTKGLDPDVPMKDSGVEWIGEIPADWKVVRLKNVLTAKRNAMRVGPFGSQLKSDDIISAGYPVYNQRTVLDDDFHSVDHFVSGDKYKSLIAFKVDPLDILITSRGTIGKIAIAPYNVVSGIIHPCIIKFSIESACLLNMFLKYIFNDTSITSEQLVLESNATTIPVVYSDNLRNILFALPSLSEQRRIVDYLDVHCANIDATISTKQTLIDKLTEYKKSLIYEVVTGKKEV